MADGNRFYHPQPSFFDEFSKGVGLGLSMRQASDRAKQIEINTQAQKMRMDEQQMRMGELQRQRGVEDTMRTYANTVLPGTENIPGEMDSGATAAAQGNQEIDPSIRHVNPNSGQDMTGVQGVYGPPTGGRTPNLREMMEMGVKAGAPAPWIKSVGDALETLQGKQARQPQTLEALAVERMLAGDNAGADEALGKKPVTGSRGGVADEIVRQLAADPTTGKLDAAKAEEVYKRIRVNPQGAEGRLVDYIIRRNTTGAKDPAMEKSIADHQQLLRGNAASREVGKEQGIQQMAQERIARMTREETAKNACRPLAESAQTAVTAMQDGIMLASKLKDDFTPEERAKYVGFVNLPVTRLMQIVKADPRFAEFNALLKRSEGTAFGEGGKALTGIEKDVVFGYIPTGRELSVADFEAKLSQAIDMGETRIRNRYEVARGGKGSPGAAIPALKPGGGPKTLTNELAIQFFKQAGGDKAKARKLAKDAGYTIPAE